MSLLVSNERMIDKTCLCLHLFLALTHQRHLEPINIQVIVDQNLLCRARTEHPLEPIHVILACLPVTQISALQPSASLNQPTNVLLLRIMRPSTRLIRLHVRMLHTFRTAQQLHIEPVICVLVLTPARNDAIVKARKWNSLLPIHTYGQRVVVQFHWITQENNRNVFGGLDTLDRQNLGGLWCGGDFEYR